MNTNISDIPPDQKNHNIETLDIKNIVYWSLNDLFLSTGHESIFRSYHLNSEKDSINDSSIPHISHITSEHPYKTHIPWFIVDIQLWNNFNVIYQPKNTCPVISHIIKTSEALDSDSLSISYTPSSTCMSTLAKKFIQDNLVNIRQKIELNLVYNQIHIIRDIISLCNICIVSGWLKYGLLEIFKVLTILSQTKPIMFPEVIIWIYLRLSIWSYRVGKGDIYTHILVNLYQFIITNRYIGDKNSIESLCIHIAGNSPPSRAIYWYIKSLKYHMLNKIERSSATSSEKWQERYIWYLNQICQTYRVLSQYDNARRVYSGIMRSIIRKEYILIHNCNQLWSNISSEFIIWICLHVLSDKPAPTILKLIDDEKVFVFLRYTHYELFKTLQRWRDFHR